MALSLSAHAQTVGGGTLASPATGPAPAYDYGYGSGISSAVLVKNWDFGTGAGSTIHNNSELSTHFQYHDQFGLAANGGGYGSIIVSPDDANKIAGQPVEGVNTSGPIREFLPSSLKTYLKPLNGATTVSPTLMNTGNGSFQAKWTPPNGGSFLGMDVIWETRVRYVTPPYFWFSIWTCGNAWASPNPDNGVPGGAEMDLIESFGYDNGGGYTNYDGRYWHSSAVGGATETNYHATWGGGMGRYGISGFDATQWHTWTWVYKADNSFVSYLDGVPVQRGQIVWTKGGRLTDPPINMSFIFDGAWGHKSVASVNHSLAASELAGKYYEWDYSRVYYRQPTPNDIRNLSLTATVSAFSSQESANPASKLIDNIYNVDTNRWSPVSGTYPHWVELDLGANKQITEAQLVGTANNSFRFRVEAKPDGGTYQTVVDRTANTSTTPILTNSITPVTARFVKLTVTGSSTNANWISIREFRVLGSDATASANLALNKPAVASSIESGLYPASNAVDGNSSTRWSSSYSDNQWIYVDLGSTQTISRVKLLWETAYASGYKIQTSNNATTWTDIYSTTTGNGATDDITGLNGSGRYLRILGVTRATGFGISLWNLEVYGPPANLALGKPATASNVQFGTSHVAANAVDGNTTTRWSTDAADNQWIYVDLGSTQAISRVKLKWETAYASGYKIQTSNNATTWTDIYSTSSGDGGVDDLTSLTGSGRYVRVLGVTRATGFGISLWDFEVYP